MKLIIVESPNKAKTISKFLDSQYLVESSYGHVRDLPKGNFGIDVENKFEPKYVIPTKARKTVKQLKEANKKADLVIIATDSDREGEAIAWHITHILNLKEDSYQRITFHEITPSAIKKALDNPAKIDMNLVNAQQARRILDRLVGYELSPFLWKKLIRGLSAGRVQSVAVRLIVDRKREIDNFKPVEYWSIEAKLQKEKNNQPAEFIAKLIKKGGKTISKTGIANKKEAAKIIQDLEKANYQVVEIQKKETKRNPLPPFTTSTLQQEASKKFGFSAKQTMRLAQKLYENGRITYHRTDSLSLSQNALKQVREFIQQQIGSKYLPSIPNLYKTKSKGAQEAHEAIRPTKAIYQGDKIKDARESKLYQLIWKRFIACQMKPAVFDAVTIDIQAQGKSKSFYLFRSNGSTVKFDGFLKIYPIKLKEASLPNLDKDEILKLLKIISEQHFTQPPALYSEASLIKTLEEYGIGRPSTYASIISTIQDRGYVSKNEQKKFSPNEIGIIVADLLKEHFPKIVDVQFTANIEKDLDKIANGKAKWHSVINNFYKFFHENLLKKYKEVEKKKLEEPTNRKCPKCGSPLVIKLGRFGKFYACSNFPECKYTETIIKSTGIKCPKCNKGEIVERKTKKGKTFYSCSRYPKCDFALWDKPTGERCPKCNSLLVTGKNGQIKCSNKECDFVKK